MARRRGGRWPRTWGAGLVLALLAACGGGSSGEGDGGFASGVFVDSPVAGLGYEASGTQGLTDASGRFWGSGLQEVAFRIGPLHLGTARAAARVTPVDLVPDGYLHHPRVVGIARLLQSLDANGDPEDGTLLTPGRRLCLASAIEEDGVPPDLGDAEAVTALLLGTAAEAQAMGEPPLRIRSAREARTHLAASLGLLPEDLARNVSARPETDSEKPKLDVFGVYAPAFAADGTARPDLHRPWYDAHPGLVDPMQGRAQPIIAVYAEESVPGSGAYDAWCAVSLDEGRTWRRHDLSLSAGRSSFTSPEGTRWPGTVTKPVLAVKGPHAIVAWTSKYVHGHVPDGTRAALAAEVLRLRPGASTPDLDGDGRVDLDDVRAAGGDPRVADPHLVVGPQLSVDTSDDPDAPPGLGTMPYSAVWVARIVIDPTAVRADEVVRVFQPEQVTSARRDAIQVTVTGASGAGFAMAWQEDPKGLRWGRGEGPGDGGTGATVNHQTDVWYSYLPWAGVAAAATDPEPGDPPLLEGAEGRPRAARPFAPPIRLTDNMACRWDPTAPLGQRLAGPPAGWFLALDPTPWLEAAGGPDVEAGWIDYEEALLAGGHTEELPTHGPAEPFKRYARLPDGRVLDGDTGSSRPVLFLQPKTLKDGSGRVIGTSAEAMLACEETKGLGTGPTDDDPHDHEDGSTTHDEEDRTRYGKDVRYHHLPHFDLGEMQGGAAEPTAWALQAGLALNGPYAGAPETWPNARRPRLVVQPKGKKGASGVVMVALWREGPIGCGYPADIVLRRARDGYEPTRFEPGVQNMSGGRYTEADVERDPATGEIRRVLRVAWTPASLLDPPDLNPYEDARAHRAQLRGDQVVVAFVHTPSGEAAGRGEHHYALYVRRSFDGGSTWTNAAGAFEPPRDMSGLVGHGLTVVEPRLMATPAGDLVDPATGQPYDPVYDASRPGVLFLAWGTAQTDRLVGGTDDEDGSVGEAALDLRLLRTTDAGETWWPLTDDADGGGILAARPDLRESESQLRPSPAGNVVVATWRTANDPLAGAPGESDIWFRRIEVDLGTD